MAMAARLSYARAPVGFLLCTVLLATTMQPALVNAKKPIVIYFLLTGTSVVSASPPGGSFGKVITFNNYGRTGPGADTTVVASALGQAILGIENSEYLDFTYKLNLTSGLVGSISGQGIYDGNGNGESAITGGTGAFRSASGYIKAEAITPNVLLKTTLYIDRLKH